MSSGQTPKESRAVFSLGRKPLSKVAKQPKRHTGFLPLPFERMLGRLITEKPGTGSEPPVWSGKPCFPSVHCASWFT